MKSKSYHRVMNALANQPSPRADHFCYIDDGELRGFGHVILDGEGQHLHAQLLDRVFPWNSTRVPHYADVQLIKPHEGKWYSLQDCLQSMQGQPYGDFWRKREDPRHLDDYPPKIDMVRLRMCTVGGKQEPMVITPGAAWHDGWTGGTLQPIVVP